MYKLIYTMTTYILFYFILATYFILFVVGKSYETFTTMPPPSPSTLPLTPSSQKIYNKNISIHDIQSIRIGGDVLIDVRGTKIKENLQPGCKKIVMRRHIGNKKRNCRSVKPVKFASCGGYCLPPWILNRPTSNLEELIQKTRYKYKCVPARTAYRKVKVYCEDDKSITIYRVKIIKNCKCEQQQQQKQAAIKTVSIQTKSSNNNNKDKIDTTNKGGSLIGGQEQHSRNEISRRKKEETKNPNLSSERRLTPV